jgi:hypothetical protein
MNPENLFKWIKRMAVATLVVVVFLFVSRVAGLYLMYTMYTWLLRQVSDATGFDPAIARPITLFLLSGTLLIPWGILVLPWVNPARRRNLLAAMIAIAALGYICIGRLTENVFFARSDGHPLKCFILTVDGYKFSDTCGSDPEFGVRYKPVDEQVYLQYLHWKKRGVKMQASTPETQTYFNILTGEPEQWVGEKSDGSCQFFPVPGFHPETGKKLEPVSEDLIRKCRQYESDTDRKRSDEADRKKTKEEYQDKQERLKRLAEIGSYSGGDHYWTLDGLRFSLREIYVLQDQLLGYMDVANLGTFTGRIQEQKVRFTLVNTDGTVTACIHISRNQGAIEVNAQDGALTLPPPGEAGSLIVEFPRRKDSSGFAIAMNDAVVFRPTHYKWTYRPF